MSDQPPSRSQRRDGFPPDEFDDIEPVPGRRGAHRARANPVLAMVPVLLVVVAVVAVVVGAMTLLGGNGPASTTASNETPVPQATGTAPPSSAPAQSSAPAESSPPPATTTTTEPPAPVDRSVPVTVLNGTRTSGLAAGATQRLREGGWTVPAADNYRGGDTPPTTVFYPSPELAATAQAVAEDLGGAQTQQSDQFDGLTVVLGEDYQP
jgi:hypothetical protein